MTAVYPNLTGEIAKRGIKRTTIAAAIGISPRALYNKLAGSVSFTLDEATTIKAIFFPDMDVNTLFERSTERRNP